MQTNISCELINGEELQRLQDEFCEVTGICAYCLNGEGQKVTKASGTGGQAEKLSEYEQKGWLKTVLERVESGSIEEQAMEVLEDGSRVAAIAVRVQGETIVYWVLYLSADREDFSEDRFMQILDLLRDASYTLFFNKLTCFSAEAESRRSRFAQQEMSRTLHTIEATTQIVQLLDCDERIETVMSRWLDILAKYLGVDSGLLFQVNQEKQIKDVLFEWLAPGEVSYFDKTRNLPLEQWLVTEKPYTYCCDSPECRYFSQFEELGVKACMVFPVLQQEQRRMVLSLNYRRQRHKWEMQEIKFTADAVRIFQSILTKRIQKNSLAGSYETLETILDNVVCGIYVTDKNTGEVLFANKRLQRIFEKELKDGSFEELLKQGIPESLEARNHEIFHEIRDTWYDLISKDILWVDGREAMLYSLYDITDKKSYQRKIEQQAYTDFLTGLYNRMCCERDLARQVDEARRTKKTGALLYLDLDDFKHINDGLGHQYGDALLKAISHALQRIHGIESTCYRMGGDEFVIIIPPEEYERLESIVENIKGIFVKPWFLKDADYYCTMSMGIVTFPDLGDSVADLIKKADIAMYEAKKSGKNRVASYNEGIDSSSGRRLDMEKNMRDATADGYNEFEVYYQPIIDVQDGQEKCAGAEALIRWNSAKLGFIPPYEFIPLAEYLGLINPIGNYVLKEACTRCKKWNDNGFPDYKVNVNLSVVQLLQTDVVEVVEQALDETGIAPRNLTLEVTESLAINDMERMKGILNRIKALGVKIALDDFGTGYSSLNHIREIPFDMIKVDQSFVRELAEDAYSQSFVKMVAELAETLGVNICVEGIETQSQYEVVRHMKVKYIQGYYFDKPMRRVDFEEKYCNNSLQK